MDRLFTLGRQRMPVHFRLERQQALWIAIAITAVTMVVEFVYSYVTGSLMLFSDGIHMLSHLAALGISLVGIRLAAKPRDAAFPFGMHKAESLAAFVNGVGLAFFSLYICYESVLRLFNPAAIEVQDTIVVAILGLVVNIATACILQMAKSNDLNMKSAIMHMLADTFSSVAIIVGAMVIAYTHWFAIDALLSLVIAGVIAKWSYGLLIKSGRSLLDAAPENQCASEIKTDLYNKFDTIVAIKDLKLWQLNDQETAAVVTVTVYPAEVYEYRYIKRQIRKRLEEKHGLHVQAVALDW